MESEEEKDRETIRSWLHSVFADLRLPAGAILVRAGVGGGATLNKEGEAWNVGWPSGLYLYLHILYLYLLPPSPPRICSLPNPRLLVGILSIPWTSGLDSSAARRNIRLQETEGPSVSKYWHTGTARFVHCTMYRLHCTVNVLGKAMRMGQMRNDADNARIFANIFGYMRLLAKYGAWPSLQCTLCNSNCR